jgi:hypothetical protein
MLAALQDGGCLTQTEWLALYPGVHCWFKFDDDPKRPWESCASCGVVRKRDDDNKPCKGIVRVTLR